MVKILKELLFAIFKLLSVAFIWTIVARIGYEMVTWIWNWQFWTWLF